MDKVNKKALIVCMAVPLTIGAVSGFLTSQGMDAFKAAEKPPLSPPDWLFPVVWTILYSLMGIASYLVLKSEVPQRKIENALKIYGLQLLFNFFWTIWYFNLRAYFFAFGWLVALWIMILAMTIMFFRISKPAGFMVLPYLLWVTFAGYLNLGVAILNR